MAQGDDGWTGPEAAEEDDDQAWQDTLPQPPRRASERVWRQVREDYLSGLTAGEVGRRWGIKISTLRARAAAEGWRRADQPPPPDPEPLPIDRAATGTDPADAPAAAPPGPADYPAMARRALARFEQALGRGAATEAATWLRLHARLLDLARPSAAPPDPSPGPPPEPPPPHPVDQLNACLREVESIARDAARVTDDDAEGQAALDARAAAVHARISAITGEDAAPEMDSIDSIDSLFSDGAPAIPPAVDPPP
jgi:hypothetical protein